MELMAMGLVLELLTAKTDLQTSMEQHCLIESVVRESANQRAMGMALVTEVKLQRVEAEYRNNGTFCGLLYNPTQFSWRLIPDDERRKYTIHEYQMAAQVVYTYLYTNPEPMLPQGTFHYINPETATDFSWYDERKVVRRWMDHVFLAGVK